MKDAITLTKFSDLLSSLWLADLPAWAWRVVTLSDYNTRVVLCGTTLLGFSAGLLGVYMLLRKRALLGDAISHATLPGVASAFLWCASLGIDKSLAILLAGAALSGSLGGLVVLILRHVVKLREDAALGIVLSVFFGAGVALMGIAQQSSGGNAAGLESFIYGKAAAMTSEDAWLCGGSAFLVASIIWGLGKELQILCFDAELARAQGWPVLLLDTLLMSLVVGVTIVGLQAVGLILVIALLVIPAAAARFWSDSLAKILLISASIGGASCSIGTLLSATFAKLPSGATIVLVACLAFVISFLFGPARGVIWQGLRLRGLRDQQDIQHFLRLAYEIIEATRNHRDAAEQATGQPIALERLVQSRKWGVRRVRKIGQRLQVLGLAVLRPDESVELTKRGWLAAQHVVRDHRLLEMYLLRVLDVDAGNVDRDADFLEHGLLPEHLLELDQAWREAGLITVPASPHPIAGHVDSAPASSSSKVETPSHRRDGLGA